MTEKTNCNNEKMIAKIISDQKNTSTIRTKNIVFPILTNQLKLILRH